MKIKSGNVTVSDSVWTELSEDFNIASWGITTDVALYVQEYTDTGWGSSISLNIGTTFFKSTSCRAIRVKSQSGNASVDYSLIGIIVFYSPYMQIGNSTDYSEFEADGTYKMNGAATVYRDELQSLIKEGLNNPSAQITQNFTDVTLDFSDSSDLTDYVVINIQINHDWKIGSPIFPHLHWFQNQNARPNWLIQYRWQSNGGAKNTSWTNYVLDTDVCTYVSGTINQKSHNTGITPPVGAGLSDIVQFRLLRDTNNDSGEFSGADPYTGDAQAINFDIHIEIDTLGSRLEYTK